MVEVGFLSLEKRGLYPEPKLDFSGVGAEEKWNLGDALRTLGMVILYAMSLFARILLVFIPQRVSWHGMSSALESLSFNNVTQDQPFESNDSELSNGVNALRSGPIGRALLQVLALLNDLPASSTKYPFARGLAEKIIQENASHGYGYEAVNRAVLAAGFERTLVMLKRSLESTHNQRSGLGDLWRLPGKFLRMIPIPSGGLKLVLPPPLSFMRTQIGHLIPSLSRISTTATVLGNSSYLFTDSAVRPASAAVGDTEMAEKLAQELLWLAEKLAESSALDEGIVQWSESSSLSSISLRSSPHIQRALVRLSSLFVKELVTRNCEVERDVKFKLLLQWLPLFCAATHGGDGPIFNISERMDLESNLDRIIKALPDSDQEVVLAIWLQEFALSSSDWPNLQTCYDRWCSTSRKLRRCGRGLETL